MKHHLILEMCGVRIRPVEVDDALFIVNLRNSSRAIGRIGDTPNDPEIQVAWINKYFARTNDYYFIIETVKNSRSVGTIGVYDIAEKVGEWGRWIIIPGVPAGPASAWLAFHICFDVLRLEKVLGHVVSTNSHVINFHKRIGNPRMGTCVHSEPVGNKLVEMVAYCAAPKDWPSISSILKRYATMAEGLL